MTPDTTNALWKDLLAFLERFLLVFLGWLEGKSDERSKVNEKSLETRLSAFEQKEVIKNETKSLSDAELARRTVNDD